MSIGLHYLVDRAHRHRLSALSTKHKDVILKMIRTKFYVTNCCIIIYLDLVLKAKNSHFPAQLACLM